LVCQYIIVSGYVQAFYNLALRAILIMRKLQDITE